MAFKDYLWVEKYRPEHIRDIVLPSKFANFFKGIVDKGETPNLLLHSTVPGSGKTAVSKALVKDLDADHLYINISSESGIDTLRSTISNFAQTKSITMRPKIVIMDECDGASNQLQAGLRAAIEEYHKHCRFILTCNYISKIITPLREGRVMQFDFNMTDKTTRDEMIPKVVKRLEGILNCEKVEYDKETLKKLVEKDYPSIRKMISTLQKYSSMYGHIGPEILSSTVVDDKLFDLVLGKDFTAARDMIIKNNYDIGELYPIFYREFVPKLNGMQRICPTILTLADYQSKHPNAIDPELNFAACLLDIISNLAAADKQEGKK